MSTEITTAFVKQFTNGITLLQQQMGSNLRSGVSVESNITGDRAFFDQVDATAMSPVATRHGDTVYTDTPHRRRMVTLATWDVADLVDRADMIRTLNDPTNAYVRSFAAAAGRRIDQTIIDAFDATAATGVDGSGSDAFDTTNYQVGGTSVMTVAKLTETRQKLEAAENMEDGGDNQWYFVTNSIGREQLLADTTLTSSDYNTVKALVNGEIDTYVGFKFLKSELLPLSGTDKISFAWRKASMKLAIGQEPRGFIDVLPGKRHSTQVRYELDLGSVRMDQKGVVQIINSQ
jgi:hypothetical protein